MSTPLDNDTCLLGKDVPFTSIEQEACRVKHFVAIARIEGGKVRGTGGMPYGLLRVESPLLPGEAIMPVVHRLDFLNAYEVFEQRGVRDDEEALVIYAPASGFFGGLKPKLHFYINPKGHFEEIYDPEFKPADARAWLTPIAVWHPKGCRV
jgi:hypothetical protein